jgi:AraC-like DNA-binding protein
VPPIDYINTLICSAMVFLIAFKLVLSPEVLTPNFDKKYKSSSLTESDSEKYISTLIDLMEKDKIYTEPELKLHELADQLTVTPHTLSQIINDRFGKSFIDYVNEYRVEAFKNRIKEINGDKVNMLTLAMEVGFNSKSAFNAAFKKITNQTPSEYKKALIDQKNL